MASVKMAEYRITKQDGTEILAVRDNIIAAATDFEDTATPQTNPITQVQRTRTGLDVSIPDYPLPVHFTVSVTPQAAKDAVCQAAPSAFTVVDGTAVVFEALPTAGWDFTGWFLDAPVNPEDAGTFDPEVPVSTDLTAVIVITSPGAGLERKVECRYEPAVP